MNEHSIFLAALDLTDPAERSAYLIKTCAGNNTLLQKVQALLASHEKSGEFLDIPALKQMSDDPGVTQELGSSMHDGVDLSYLAPSTKPDSLGTLAHYEILRVLGQGGFGTVLKAFDEKLHRLVAIKVLSREMAATSPPRKRFLREARSVAAIKHENVIAIHSVEEHPLPYFVMEFVDGATLQDKRDEAGPIPVSEILHIGKQIASGLAAAHALGLIHRDIKPANILIEKGVMQKVKITDFGLARAADDASMTQSGVIAGTPLYMAPEQAKGAKLDARTDLFSLGSVLYTLATGHPPFRAPSTFAVLRRVTEDTQRPMQEIISDIPDWLVAIVDKLLAKEPEDRFQSAQELVDVLAQCQSELQAGVPVTALKKLGVTHQPPSIAASRAVPQQNKFPVLGVAAGVMLMFAVMAASLFFLNKYKGDGNDAVGPSATQQVRATTTLDDDRTAAEWVLSKGGKILKDHSPDQPGISEEVNLSVNPVVFNSIILNNDAIDDNDLDNLKELKSLASLQINGSSKITSQGIAKMAAMPWASSLKYLQVVGTQPSLSDEVFAEIAKFPALKIVNLVCESKTTGRGLVHLKGMEIRELGLNGFDLDATAARHLLGLQKLDSLSLESVPITDELVAVIGELKGLKSVRFASYGKPGVTDVGLKKMADLKLLETLRITTGRTTNEGLSGLREFPRLKLLEFNSCNTIDDSSLKIISQLGSIVDLQVPGCPITDEGLRYLAAAKGLKSVMVQGKITAIGVQDFRMARPECAIISPHGGFAANDVSVINIDNQEGSSTFKNSIGMEFVRVPKGNAWLGGGFGQQGNTKVEIEQDFYLGKYEVTQEQWETVTGLTPSQFSRTGPAAHAVKDISDEDLKRFPAENVSWEDCQLFIERLNKKEKDTGRVYRLPKEAEWEYACRGGPGDKMDGAFDFYLSKPTNTLLPDQANFASPQPLNRTTKVGSYQPNVLGLYDMHGNIWEWCEDEEKTDKGKSLRVYRGGCWLSEVANCRSAFHYAYDPTLRNFDYGLRVALGASGVNKPD